MSKRKRLALAFQPIPPHDEGVPFDRPSMLAPKNMVADTDLIETTPDLPHRRTASCRGNLRAALAFTEGILKQLRMTPAAAVLGCKGGSAER